MMIHFSIEAHNLIGLLKIKIWYTIVHTLYQVAYVCITIIHTVCNIKLWVVRDMLFWKILTFTANEIAVCLGL